MADFSAPSHICIDCEVSFDASDSYDPDGTELSYDWNFGSGAYDEDVSDPVHPTCKYSTAGVKTVILEVTDDDDPGCCDGVPNCSDKKSDPNAVETVTVVRVDKVVENVPPYTNEGPLYTCIGESISLIAIAYPSGAFPAGEPHWSIESQPAGASATLYPSTGSSLTNLSNMTKAGNYVIKAKCGDSDTGDSVTIYVMKVEIDEPEPSEFPKYIGVDSSLTLKAKLTPSSATGGTFTWSKVTGPGSVTFSPNGESENTTSFSSSTVGSYTVKVEYTIDGVTCDSDSSGTIVVCNAKMFFKAGTPPIETSSLTRTESGTFEVLYPYREQIPGATYSDWAFDGKVDVFDPGNTSNTWGGTIVQSGRASCTVDFGETTCEVNKSITVNARSGWSITPTCIQDNEPGWVDPDDPHGGFPFIGPPGWVGGEHRNIDNGSYAITPRGPNYQDGYTTAKVNIGANKGVWYIESSSFVISMETAINKYVKSGTTPPTPPGTNFYEKNQSKGVDAAAFLQSIKNHEYEGTGGNGHGHYAYVEVKEATFGYDAKERIEDNVADRENDLKFGTAIEVVIIEEALWNAGEPEPPEGSNWSGTIWVFDFDASPQEWFPVNVEF